MALAVLAVQDLRGLEGELFDLRLPCVGVCGMAIDRDNLERIRYVEARVGARLRLKEPLSVVLTRGIERRRAALEEGDALVTLYRAGTGPLFDLRVSLDGERVTAEFFHFMDERGITVRTKEAREGRGKYAQPLRDLPLFFDGVERVAATIEDAGFEVLSMAPASGNVVSTPRYSSVRFEIRPEGDEHRVVRGEQHLVLDPTWSGAPDPWVPVGDDRVVVESVARALRRPLEVALEENTRILEALDLPFEHTVTLDDFDPDRRVLSVFVPRPRGERCLTYAHLWRDAEPPDWRVTEWTGKRRGASVPLAHYAKLVRAAVALADSTGVSLGAFAVAGGGRASTALVVTVPEGSLWHTTVGAVHVLRVFAGFEPEIVERAELRDFDIENVSFRRKLVARALDGRALSVETRINTCGTEYDPNPPVRFGTINAALLGGSALRDQNGSR